MNYKKNSRAQILGGGKGVETLFGKGGRDEGQLATKLDNQMERGGGHNFVEENGRRAPAPDNK